MLAGSHVWTVGYELTYDDILDKAPAYDRTIDQFARDHGIYIQDDWAITDDFSFLFGSRFDKHSFIDDMVISPRANIMYKLMQDMNLRATFSTGFRSPQTFDEDLHITQVSGEALIHLNSPDLKPEYSMSFGTSLDYTFELASIPTSVSVEYFRTHLDDVFVNVALEEENDQGFIIEEKRNGGGAVVQGATFELQMQFDDEMDFKTGFTFQSSQYDDFEEWNENEVLEGQSNKTKDMMRSPDWYGYFSYNWSPIHEIELNLSGILTGPMIIPHYAGGIDADGFLNKYDQLEKSKEFFELNAQLSFEISHENNAKVFVGVQNILNSFQDDFDKGLGRDAGYIYGPTRPITVFCGIKTSI
jgi:outer membrane receptor for ferrienterochelin and colicins